MTIQQELDEYVLAQITAAPGMRAAAIVASAELDGIVLDGTNEVRTCLHCLAAATWLDEECNGHLFGGVSEELSEHWGMDSSYRSVWLARALVGIKRKWKRKDGSLMPILETYVRREVAV